MTLHQCGWIIGCLWGFRWFVQLYMLWKKWRSLSVVIAIQAMSEKSFIKAAYLDSFWFSEVFRFAALITPAYSQPWVNYKRRARHIWLIRKMYILLKNKKGNKIALSSGKIKSFKVKPLVLETCSALYIKSRNLTK